MSARFQIRGPHGTSRDHARWTVVDTSDRDISVDTARRRSDALVIARELNARPDVDDGWPVKGPGARSLAAHRAQQEYDQRVRDQEPNPQKAEQGLRIQAGEYRRQLQSNLTSVLDSVEYAVNAAEIGDYRSVANHLAELLPSYGFASSAASALKALEAIRPFIEEGSSATDSHPSDTSAGASDPS